MIKNKPKSLIKVKKLSDVRKEEGKKLRETMAKEVTKNTEVFNGVYMIHNTLHNKKYIGSTKDINRRFKTHKRELEMGSHNNRKMQKDYDEAGPNQFIYTVLERDLDESMLTAYEKYYMYIHDSIVMYKGYNDIFPTTNHILFQEVCRSKRIQNDKKYEEVNHEKIS